MTTVCIEPQTAAQKEQAKILPPGAKAPDFTLHVTPDQCLSLSDLAGKPVVIAFYPADWSPVCGDQMTLYNEALPEFEKYGAEVLGISVDGAWCHDAFAKHLGSGRQAIRRIPRERGTLRARAVRHRPERSHRLELSVALGGQSRRRRHPASARATAGLRNAHVNLASSCQLNRSRPG